MPDPRLSPQMPPEFAQFLQSLSQPQPQQQQEPSPEELQALMLQEIAAQKGGMPTAQPAEIDPQLGQPMQTPVAQPGPAGNLGEPMQTPVDTTDKAAAIRQMMEQNAAGLDPFPGAGDSFNKPIGILEQMMGNLGNVGITAASAGTIPPGLIDLIRGKGQ